MTDDDRTRIEYLERRTDELQTEVIAREQIAELLRASDWFYDSCSAPYCEAHHRLIEQKFHISHCQNFRGQLCGSRSLASSIRIFSANCTG